MNGTNVAGDRGAPADAEGSANTFNMIDVPVKGSDAVVTIDCSDLPSDPRDLCAILSGEEADSKYWTRLALEYRHISLIDQAIAILQDGLNSHYIQRQDSQRYYFHSLLASLYIQKTRTASTGIGEIGQPTKETKDFWQQKALQALTDSMRLKPRCATNLVTKGALSILRMEKDKSPDEAIKLFDLALKEEPRNLFAMLGKARILYGRKNYKAALAYYQKVLQLQPSMVPDPRIGIGLCFWQLNMKDDASAAWNRSLELDNANPVAKLLLGLYWISNAFESVSDEARFQQYYSQGIKLVSFVYKLQEMPLGGIALAAHMFSSKKLDSLQRILEKALASTDLSSIKADAFFWIGRGQHQLESFEKANSFYALAKQTDPDSIVAPMAMGQLQLTREDVTDAKLTFESVLEKQPKCIEALAVLGAIYAQEALDPNFKGDKVTHRIKAKACLDKAIHLTDESPRRSHVDPSLHFTKAMLAEDDAPSQALRTLEQAADIQSENDSSISPQILNNMAVVHHLEGSFEVAREVYQKAIEECIKAAKPDPSGDADVLLASITYNLGRCEETSGRDEHARQIYAGLLERYPDYVEAAARLAYMDITTETLDQTTETVKGLVDLDQNNIEVRALFGWLLTKQKRVKPTHFNEDPARKHFNHTLKYVDNYERYSLVALGNFYIKLARETRADNDANKAERHKHYDMAIKFFERALHYDPSNAYAAQGLGIAFAEHKQYQRAISIFSKVRETLRDESIFLNMGHCLCELHQYSRAIENYETALKTFHAGRDLNLYQCLGRAWLSRGREERSAEHLREALRYAKLANDEAPGNTSIMFNVAFVQFQFAEVLRNTPELSRTVLELEEAAAGLDEAVKTFTLLAEHKQPPYPKADIQQRATMGRNTTRKQLERAIQQQKEFESKNEAKVAEARAKRDEERKRKEAAQEDMVRAELARQELLVQKRKEMQEEARQWAERKRQEEEEREARELERVANRKEKKAKGKKNKGDYESDEDPADAEPGSERTPARPKKRRTLRRPKKSRDVSNSEPEAELSGESDLEEQNTKPTKKRKLSKKYISAEMVDSDDDDENMDDQTKLDGAGSPRRGGQAYANEAMLDDRERDNEPDAADVQASNIPGSVPVDDSHAPRTNGQGSDTSVLQKQSRDTLKSMEEPGLPVDG